MLTISELAMLQLRLPEQKIQQSIAAVLDNVDEGIAKTEAAIAKLRQAKAI